MKYCDKEMNFVQLEKQCKDLECQLDKVKIETSKISSDLINYKNQNCDQESDAEILLQDLQTDKPFEKLTRESNDSDEILCCQDLNKVPDIHLHKENTTFNQQALEKCIQAGDSNEISKLKLKIEELEQSMTEVEGKYELEKKDLLDKNRQLEQSLDLMKDEFESMEDYWQGKMDKERTFYEDQIRDSEEKFKELEERLKEYIELLPEKGAPHVVSEGLYTIEEASSIEYQVMEWEEEIKDLRMKNEELLGEQERSFMAFQQLEQENRLLAHQITSLLGIIAPLQHNPSQCNIVNNHEEKESQSLPFYSEVYFDKDFQKGSRIHEEESEKFSRSLDTFHTV